LYHDSVLLGRDNEALEILIALHSRPDPQILDVTHNQGTMWKGTQFTPTRMDIDPSFDLDIVGDFKDIPVPDESYDIIVFDPPHLPNAAATEKSSKIWERRYGLTATGREGDNVSSMFLPFLREAKRVLRPDGVVLAKIADLVHNHRYQWQHIHLIEAAWEVGFVACDCLIKRDPNAGNLKSSKWQNPKHLRKSHCYWIVLRKSKYCELKVKNAA
jgi:SAM-dependent methyltransferase